MKVNLSGKVCGRLQAKRLDLQRKWKRTLDINQTIELLLEEVE